VLDAYSGSGALGFEALSRGAREVVFIEADAAVVRLLRESAAGLDVARRCRIHHGRVLELMAGGKVPGRFELILADPPYATDEVGVFLNRAASLLAPDGVVVLEGDLHAEPVADAPPGLCRLRTARYGSNRLEFFGTREADASG
jgi:16S rRNA (guanine966-N2)-methyltransferase